MIWFYLVFSYLFVLGMYVEEERKPDWWFLLAPLTIPMFIGMMTYKLSSILTEMIDRMEKYKKK